MSSEKTEQPTPKKLRDARKKGQVAKSQDVAAAALTITCFTVVSILWYPSVLKIQELIQLPTKFYDQPFEKVFMPYIAEITRSILIISAPLLFAVLVVGVAANLGQFGFMIVFEPLKPDLKKLNPIDKLKNIFSVKNFIEFLKSAIKVAVIGIVGYLVLKNSMHALMNIPYGGETQILVALKPMVGMLAWHVALAYVTIAAADYFFQKFQHTKQLKMSKDEVKREYKESEGDPEIKGKRKQLHQEMVNNATVENTRKSDVVVTNPTHLAIAISYDSEFKEMPRVLAKGEDHVARRMVKAAQEEGIPVMQHVPLARALHEGVDIYRYIPADLIEPLAEVLSFVEQLKNENDTGSELTWG